MTVQNAKRVQGSGAAIAAKNIKAELKIAFPETKFSVRSDRSSVNVSWTDGPTTNCVQSITSKYEEGSFNGMEDIYEYDREVDTSYGSARYVFEEREIGEAGYAKLTQAVCAKFNVGNAPSFEEYNAGGAWYIELFPGYRWSDAIRNIERDANL